MEQEIEELEIPKKNSLGWLWILLVVCIVVILVVFLVPLPYNVTVKYKETVPTKETQAYYDYESTPVTRTETYTDTEPYSEKVCDDVNLKYNVKWESESVCLRYDCLNPYQECVQKNLWGNCVQFAQRCSNQVCAQTQLHCRLRITNLDNTEGTFKVRGAAYDYASQENEFVKEVSVYIQGGDYGVATWTYNFDYPDSYSCNYIQFDTGTKKDCNTVIKNRQVSKTRTVQAVEQKRVQKYKDVIVNKQVDKQRVETRYRTIYGWLVEQ